MDKHGLTLSQIEAIRGILCPFAADIEKAGLFGSRAMGNARQNSDIDLVIYGLKDQKKLDRIHTMFTESLLPFTVDVKSYDLLQYAPLKLHIDQCMQLLFTQTDLQQGS